MGFFNRVVRIRKVVKTKEEKEKEKEEKKKEKEKESEKGDVKEKDEPESKKPKKKPKKEKTEEGKKASKPTNNSCFKMFQDSIYLPFYLIYKLFIDISMYMVR